MSGKIKEEELPDKVYSQYCTLRRLASKSRKELNRLKRKSVNLKRELSCQAFSEWVLQRCLESIAHTKAQGDPGAYAPLIELSAAIEILKVARNNNLVNLDGLFNKEG